MESEAVSEVWLRLWIQGDIYVGCRDGFGPGPLIYKVGRVVDPSADVWTLLDGNQAQAEPLAPSLLCDLTWPRVQAIADDLDGFVAALIVEALPRLATR